MTERIMENGRKEVNQNFYRKLLIVGIPMIIQQVIAVTLNLADTIMVGKVGENALAAVGAANQIYFIFGVVLFGVFSGAAVHAVQYWGIRDIVSLRKIIGIDYTVCLTLAVPVTVFVFLTAPGLIRLFAEDAEVVLLGTKYLRIACFSYIFSGLTFVISYNSRAIQDVKVPTIINGCAILMNVICNYLLIYGKCGFPKLGVEGAAIATLLARVLECAAMYLSVYLRKEYPLKAKPGELFAYSGELFAGVMKTAVPVIITEGLWAVSVSCIFAAYGKISASAFAVSQVAVTVTDFFQTIYFGLGNATPVSEFNVFIDAEAYALMLGCGIPVTIAGFDLCTGSIGLDRYELAYLSNSTPAGTFLERATSRLLQFNLDTRGVHLVDLPDAIAIAAAVWPDFVREKVSCHCHCCTEQGHAYGQVIFYQKGRTYEAIPEISSFNAEVITKIDEQVFTENFMNLFTPASHA